MGGDLVVDTARHIGPAAANAETRFAGNDLSLHQLPRGSQSELPFPRRCLSTFTSYPLVVDDRSLTLVERINDYVTRT